MRLLAARRDFPYGEPARVPKSTGGSFIRLTFPFAYLTRSGSMRALNSPIHEWHRLSAWLASSQC